MSGKESILDSVITIICAYFVQYIHRSRDVVFTEMRPAHWETLIIIIIPYLCYGCFRLGSGDSLIIIYIHK